MCGIFCLLTKSNHDFYNIYEKCECYLKRRGPDSYKKLETTQHGFNIKLAASVLWLQGDTINLQPIETDSSLFAYNGDIFGGDFMDRYRRRKEGDTQLFLNALEENSDDIFTALKSAQGPYAFIYIDKKAGKLYFARDIFGRRSLLIAKRDNGIVITSVACKAKDLNFFELPAVGVFSYDLTKDEFELHPWYDDMDLGCLNDFNKLVTDRIIITRKPELEYVIDDRFFEPPKLDLEAYEILMENKEQSPFELMCSNSALWDKRVSKLIDLLESSVRKRISNQPKYCHDCIKSKANCNHSRVAVLFSGGIDCTILALIADKFVDENCSIDLLNVAFGTFNTPDRETGLISFEELKSLRPNRKWNFVPIDVPTEELDKMREEHIKHLIHPLNTILDDSLGCALWFASRGQKDGYVCPARVVLVGMGADELFGGYMKHRKAFTSHGWEGLCKSMEDDWKKISHRNLGRDDRMVSDHGRQLRTPYLDEMLVEFVRSLKVWKRTYPVRTLPEGVEDKILLRCAGYKLGLQGASKFRKRALQFGCRIADSKEKAHEPSPRLQ